MISKNSSANKKRIPYGRQSIAAEDIRAVVKVLKSDWLTQGPTIRRFEEAFAKYCGAPYAVAVSNGTAGLHLAALAAGFKKGDEVLTSPMTFAATANAALYTGADVVFSDVEPHFIGLNPASIQRPVSQKTRGIINVHFGGHPSRIGSKNTLSPRKDFYLIEDSCHALGAEVRAHGTAWKKIGSCDEADMSVFSFHPVKHITTGEGGMITTRRKDLYEKILLLRSHGIEKNTGRFVDKTGKNKPWHYEMQALGFNYRITDFQCALGLSQLDRLDEMVAKRRGIAAFYQKALKNIEFLRVPEESVDSRSSYHLYPVRIDFKKLKKTREEIMKALSAQGIGTQVHYIPVILQPYYRERYHLKLSDYPECARYYDQTLSIPMFPSMTKADQQRVVRALELVLRKHA